MDSTYIINQDCDLLENRDNAIIFFESNEKVYILNDIENEILNLIKKKNTLSEIINKLANKYNAKNEVIKNEVIKNDVSDFVNNLLKANLIIEEKTA